MQRTHLALWIVEEENNGENLKENSSKGQRCCGEQQLKLQGSRYGEDELVEEK